MNVLSNLTERLVEAAAEAIRNEVPTLEHDPNGLRGLVLDVTISNGGAVLDVDCHVTRRRVFRAEPARRKLQPALEAAR